MRFYVVSVGLLIATCCLLSPQQVNATPNTYTYSTIDFDDSTGTIVAAGHTQADYQTGAYYRQTGAGLSLVDAYGNLLGSQQRQVYGTTVDVSAQTDAYADQKYTVRTGHYLLATYYLYNYYYQGQYVSGYDDQYNYSSYEGQNINNVDDYIFYGNGPLVVSQYTNDFILGQTTKRVKVGTPDHVWVVADDTTYPDYPDCGRPVRVIGYKVVDVNNHATGITRFQEKPYSIFDSCVGSYTTVGGNCNTTLRDASFTDTINVQCPTWHPCGFNYPNQFSWCEAPYDDPKIVIATVNADASDTAVVVDGFEKFPLSTTIYP